MSRLGFLIGKWSGEAQVLRGPGDPVELAQTEEAQYKLGGLLLEIEGYGRKKSDGATVLQALGIISYDDENATYCMRAFNDGRYLETDVKLLEQGTGLSWGFTLGEVRTSSVLQINEKGEWTEHHEIVIGAQPARTLMDVTVRRRS